MAENQGVIPSHQDRPVEYVSGAMSSDIRQRKRDRMTYAIQCLNEAGIANSSNNGGIHAVVSHKGFVVDYWPSTGLWKMRTPPVGKGTQRNGRGLQPLLTNLKNLIQATPTVKVMGWVYFKDEAGVDHRHAATGMRLIERPSWLETPGLGLGRECPGFMVRMKVWSKLQQIEVEVRVTQPLRVKIYHPDRPEIWYWIVPQGTTRQDVDRLRGRMWPSALKVAV